MTDVHVISSFQKKVQELRQAIVLLEEGLAKGRRSFQIETFSLWSCMRTFFAVAVVIVTTLPIASAYGAVLSECSTAFVSAWTHHNRFAPSEKWPKPSQPCIMRGDHDAYVCNGEGCTVKEDEPSISIDLKFDKPTPRVR